MNDNWWQTFDEHGGRVAATGGLAIALLGMLAMIIRLFKRVGNGVLQMAKFVPDFAMMPQRVQEITVTLQIIETRQRVMEGEQKTMQDAVADLHSTTIANLENSETGHWMSDAAGRCIFVTGMLQEIMGVPSEEILADSWMGAIHEEDRDMVIERWTRLVTHGEPFRLVYRYKSRDGRVTKAKVAACPKKNPATGKVMGYLGRAERIPA